MLARLATLPRTLIIGISIVFMCMLAGVVVMATSGSATIDAASTSSIDQVNAWRWRLDKEKVQYRIVQHGSSWTLRVSEDDAVATASGIAPQSKAPVSTRKRCPEVSGLSAVKANLDERKSCLDEAKLHDYMVGISGILEATPNVRHESPGFGEPEESSATIQLWLDPGTHLQAEPANLARGAANIIGSKEVSSISIDDTEGNHLWPVEAGRAGAGSCPAISRDDDLAMQERGRSACLSDEVRRRIATVLAIPREDVTVFANVRLWRSVTEKKLHRVTTGVVIDRSVERSGVASQPVGRRTDAQDAAPDSQSLNTTQHHEPTVRDELTQTPAGDIRSQRISIGIRGITNAELATVRRLVANTYPQASSTVLRVAATPSSNGKAAVSTPVSVDDSPRARPPVHLDTLTLVALAIAAALLAGVAASMLMGAIRRRTRAMEQSQRGLQSEIARLNHAIGAQPDVFARDLEALLARPPHPTPAPDAQFAWRHP